MFRLINKLKNRKGFTLIELIVVLAVLAIIMAIAVPRYMGVQEKAKVDSDYSTGAMIAKAAELYYAQHPEIADADVMAAGLATATGTASKLIGEDITAVKFQSKNVLDKTIADVRVTYAKATGTVVVDVKTGTDTYIKVYPKTGGGL